jgi:hypothetical protein
MVERVVAVALVACAAAAPAYAKSCKPISGTFDAVALPPFSSSCPSFFCTEGNLVGDLTGTYFFVAAAPTETGFTGNSTITTKNGVIHGNDVSVLFGPPVPGTAFQTTVTIADGTRKYDGATGYIVAAGALTETGTSGTYSGQICRPAEAGDDA